MVRGRESAELWLSVLVIGELRRGVALIQRRDADAGERIGSWLDSPVDDYADRIMPITQPIAERWRTTSVPDPLPVVDGLLAATAIENDLTLVTRNITDVVRTPVMLTGAGCATTVERRAPDYNEPGPHEGDTMKIDLFVDLNTEDDTGLPWTYADQAADPSLVKGRPSACGRFG